MAYQMTYIYQTSFSKYGSAYRHIAAEHMQGGYGYA